MLDVSSTPIRNIAIIAHVDHGKTTLVDGLLKQAHTFRENEAAMSQTLIMDSNDQERERGITILAKNTSVVWNGTKINIIDTPGHADFSGEIERTLNMADGVLLLVDAQEGPMPQTKFVLSKALDLGLKVIVVVNKIDKKDARIPWVLDKVGDLFLDLAETAEQLDYPVYYCIGREAKAWAELPENPEAPADLTPLFEGIMTHIPAPQTAEGSFQMLASSLDWDQYQGKYVLGRIVRGEARPGLAVKIIQKTGEKSARIDKVYVSAGLKRLEVAVAEAGDIVSLTGIAEAGIGDTIADASNPEALPTIHIAEPTLKMSIAANTSPFSGREGKFVTSRQLLDRIERELEHNVSLALSRGDGGEYVLAGRGELHLAVFLENLRREGYEMQVGKPQVILHEQDGVTMEPVEELTVDVQLEYVGAVTGEIGRRKGVLLKQEENNDGTARLLFEITTRGILGLRSALLTLSRGTAVMHSLFAKYTPYTGELPRTRNGVLITSETGKTLTYGLNVAQGRGATFVPPQTEVYEGMIIGLNSREDDIEINVCKEKKQTNVRASSADISVALTPPVILSLEQCLDFLEDDELLEITPKSLRLRKKLLTSLERSKARRG